MSVLDEIDPSLSTFRRRELVGKMLMDGAFNDVSSAAELRRLLDELWLTELLPNLKLPEGA